MRIDVHVHVSACTPGKGKMSDRLLRSFPFRFLRWRYGIVGTDEKAECAVKDLMVRTIEETVGLDAAVVLAFDAAHDRDGRFDDANTHLYVTNDYVIELARQHRKILFGCSVHPYRKDAVAELEHCVAAGAVLCKWLPIVQNFNPADDRCVPFYEALAHHGLPLLSHTGGEQCLPNLDKTVASPRLLEPALKRGVKVIAAHCGTRATPWERSYLDEFVTMCHEHEHFYGDTSALNLPSRWQAYRPIFKDRVVREKLVHGSDWPVIVLPPPLRVGLSKAWRFLSDGNWIRRDVAIKEALGLDDAYFRRAASILKMPERARAGVVQGH